MGMGQIVNKVILYGDKQTDAIKNLLEITLERRKIQDKHNKDNGIVPKTIIKTIDDMKFRDNKEDKDNVSITYSITGE